MKIAILGSVEPLGIEIIKTLNKTKYTINEIDLNALNSSDHQSTQTKLESLLPLDIIINCTAMSNVYECEKNYESSFNVNSLSLLPLANFCKANNITLFHISTDHVFDGKKLEPYLEDDKTNPLNVYGLSKLGGENIITSIMEKYFILRTSTLYGFQEDNFIESAIQKARRGHRIEATKDQLVSPTHTLELARCLFQFIDKGVDSFGLYHFASKDRCSLFELTEEVFRQLDIKAKIKLIKSKEGPSSIKRPLNRSLSVKKIKTYYAPKAWQESVSEYLNIKGYL